VDLRQPALVGPVAGCSDDAAVERHQAARTAGGLAGCDHAVAGARQTGIDAKDDHRLRFCARRRTPAWRTLPPMPSEEIDFAAEGLLDGLEGEQRSDRLTLLENLAADGVGLVLLRRATENGTVMLLPAEKVIAGTARYTAEEVVERTGVEMGFLTALRRAMGLPIPEPDEPVYTEADLEMVQMTHQARELGIGEAEMLELDRTLGRALGQAAEALRAVPMRLVLEPGVSEPELAARYADAAAKLYPMVQPLVANLLSLHMRNVTESEIISAAERSGGRLPGSREVAVCFADLVGFTRLGEEVPPDELGRLAVRLEALATDVAEPPVRLVKTIGDAAMLTSAEPAPLIDATLP
jgi:adenylate cyclase